MNCFYAESDTSVYAKSPMPAHGYSIEVAPIPTPIAPYASTPTQVATEQELSNTTTTETTHAVTPYASTPVNVDNRREPTEDSDSTSSD